MEGSDLLTVGTIGTGFGVIAKSLFDFLAQRGSAGDIAAERRERLLWVEIGKLQSKIEALEKKVDAVTADNVRLMLENASLKNEVDDLLHAQGKPPKYHNTTTVTTVTTTTPGA